MPSPQSRRWVFTLNNPTDDEEQHLGDLCNGDSITYAVFGRETGDSGTPHLQGFIIFPTPKRLSAVRTAVSLRGHYEPARGTSSQASLYCKKDNDFEEFGSLPDEQGKRTDIERYVEWVKLQANDPSTTAIALEFPGLWLRYGNKLQQLAVIHRPKPVLVDGHLRDWQIALGMSLEADAEDRKVLFIVDPDGGKGKSWFVRYMLTNRDDAQKLSIGKRDDISYAIDEFKRIFLFDVPRGSMEYLNYNIFEQLKDQLVFSVKYESRTKILRQKVHVIVFCNEEPDMNKMTGDRYVIINI